MPLWLVFGELMCYKPLQPMLLGCLGERGHSFHVPVAPSLLILAFYQNKHPYGPQGTWRCKQTRHASEESNKNNERAKETNLKGSRTP